MNENIILHWVANNRYFALKIPKFASHNNHVINLYGSRIQPFVQFIAKKENGEVVNVNGESKVTIATNDNQTIRHLFLYTKSGRFRYALKYFKIYI